MGKTTQGTALTAAATRQNVKPAIADGDISLLPPRAEQELQIWQQQRQLWRRQAQDRAKYWSQCLTSAQQQDVGEQQLRALAASAAQELIAERIDRWRNDPNGYDRLTQELGLAGVEQGVTELISGQDQRPEFQQFALHFATEWLQEKALNGNKLTPGFLMEQVSHGANRAYLAELFQEVDDHPEKVGERIFNRNLDPKELGKLKRVAGLAANSQVAAERQEAENLPRGTSDFWYQVRKQWQDGIITNQQQLAEYTAEQMRRYG